MAVPLLDVNAQNHPLEAEFTAAFQRVFRSGTFIMGPEITAFEAEAAALLRTKHCIALSSGTDALLAAFMALGIGHGDEVLCPAFTFFATAGCVARTGATPVFTDVCPVTFNMDLSDARRKITPRTKAIVPVHLYGQSADMDGVLALAKEHQLAVIEDAAQAFGALSRGQPCGTMGDFGAYSFFPSKNLGGLGDSGLLSTNDDALADLARSMRNHGMQPKYFHSHIGGNFRMDALQAALLRVKLPHYQSYTERRQANADYYTEQLLKLPDVIQAEAVDLGDMAGQDNVLMGAHARLVLPVALPHNSHIWNQYTLRILGGERDKWRDHLASRKIGCDIYYPLTLDQQECFADLPESSRADCPVAHRLAGEVLSIPVYPELSQAQKDEVIAALAEMLA